MNTQIPIYKAKKINSDEYVEGNLLEDEGVFYIIKNPVITHFNGLQILTGEYEYLHIIDPTTLAIHFPSMVDSQGNKIFASLSEDGKGGDIVEDNGMFLGVTKYDIQSIYYGNFRKDELFSWAKLKVIGVQQ